jgi:hypothetical protein
MPFMNNYWRDLFLAAACLGRLAGAHDIDFKAPASDPTGAGIAKMVEKGQRDVESFFHSRFREVIHVTVVPTRADFDAAFPASWGMGKTECWMVATGVADFLVMLSPSAWKKEACDHEPDDATEVQRIVTHELVHVFHGQHNPSRDFTGADEVGWFVEGLAVLASGQLDRERLKRTVDAVRSGDVPKTLNDSWTGPNRYGRAGSIIRYLDVKFGRQKLIELLPVLKQSDLLARLGVTEAQLLHDWQAWLSIQN